MVRHMFARIAVLTMCFILAAAALADLVPTRTRKTAPDFTLSDSQGASVRLSVYKGKVVVLDFWATWCGGCKEEITWYIGFQKKYKENGLLVVGVAMDEDGWKSVKPFLEENKLNYLCLPRHRCCPVPADDSFRCDDEESLFPS